MTRYSDSSPYIDFCILSCHISGPTNPESETENVLFLKMRRRLNSKAGAGTQSFGYSCLTLLDAASLTLHPVIKNHNFSPEVKCQNSSQEAKRATSVNCYCGKSQKPVSTICQWCQI